MNIPLHPNLHGKKILIGITGSIAAYKSAELIRQLRLEGAEIRVILTEGGHHFMTPETLSVLSGHEVYQSLWESEKAASITHIMLARWADVILIAPATAHFMAKVTHGFADDLLGTVCVATTSKIILLPAMNKEMWLNAATQSNLALLSLRGIACWGPDEGLQACQEEGEGRMLEPSDITMHLNQWFSPKYLQGKKILITAGPTHEALDPVRVLTNHSSGKMGYHLAEAANEAGAKITLISGPTVLNCSDQISRVDVSTCLEMRNAVMEQLSSQDIFISAAAVSDYRFETISSHKFKKNQNKLTLTLIKNPDILIEIAQLSSKPCVIGFAAETENLVENAKTKLKYKKLDMIVANVVGKNKGFQSDFNEVMVITKHASQKIAYAHKKVLARKLLALIESYIHQNENKKALF